jgi:hypothetical protein
MTLLTAKNADKHRLYQIAVQCPEAEIDFVTATFKKLRGRPARLMREDFCGTAFSACEFVKRHKDNRAVGLDLHQPTLDWGRRHNLSQLNPDEQRRIRLLRRDVLQPGKEGSGVDFVNAMNFSYWLFHTSKDLCGYFMTVRGSLARDGVLFLDVHGGYEATKVMQERRRLSYRGNKFKYVWDQQAFDPISNRCRCAIHFEFEKGPALMNAFVYRWRVWSVPEIREMLAIAGFRKSTVYLEGDDGKGGGDGVFRPRTKGDADASFIGYIVAEK